MRFLKLSFTTTGSALFGLDLVLVVALWLLTMQASGAGSPAMPERLDDMRIGFYPLAVLLLLFAMGVYRRDAILEPYRTAGRIPLVVGMGGMLATLASIAAVVLWPSRFVWYGGHALLMLFGLATVSMTNGGSLSGSLRLNVESSWRYSAVEASSQLIRCSAPCEFT